MTVDELRADRDHFARLAADALVHANDLALARKWAARSEEFAVRIRAAVAA